MEDQEYKGYSLFADIEDKELRTRNRAVVLWNMYESSTQKKRTTPSGVADMIGYMRKIPDNERQSVMDKLTSFIEGGGNA